MFGYVLVNKAELKIREYEVYRSYYCGLCHRLKERHGFMGRLTLNYDMTFLIMLLSELYDVRETQTCGRCIVHPFHRHCSRTSVVSDYCADMCVLLAYYKCQDDWNDDHKLKAWICMKLLRLKVRKIQSQYPKKAEFVAKKMKMLSMIENTKQLPIDKITKIFGEIMAEIFVYKEDIWKDDLYKVGFYLGKFIYLLDAYEDIEEDIQGGDFNPFKEIYYHQEFDQQVSHLLLLMIGECADAFERLPLTENVEILRNILYSGIWGRYETTKKKRLEKNVKEEKNGSV